jgi:hypothetical protein
VKRFNLDINTMNAHTDNSDKNRPDANPDPITGQPGAHPVGTGVGAAGAGVIGTAVGGVVGGPVGAVVGAAIGSVAGGLAGKGVAEHYDPTVEDTYWRENYKTRPYAESDYSYDDYSPAYRTGYDGYTRYGTQGMTYDQAQPRLREDYERDYGTGRLGWDKAQYATRDAWDRVEGGESGYAMESDYWRNNYTSRPYWDSGYDYSDYDLAYRTGYNGYRNYANQGMSFAEAEPRLRQDYERQHGDSRLGWDKAKYAVQDSWNRLESAVTGNDVQRRR